MRTLYLLVAILASTPVPALASQATIMADAVRPIVVVALDTQGRRVAHVYPAGSSKPSHIVYLDTTLTPRAGTRSSVHEPYTGRMEREAFSLIIKAAASTHGVDEHLIRAVIQAESRYNPNAHSPAGAMGLMQLIPGTAARMGVKNAYDPTENIHGGTLYLKKLLAMFDNDLTKTIAAYNAGEGAVMKYGGVPPYKETMNYVPQVMKFYHALKQPPLK